MNISQILARDAEDAWIAKYRKAMEVAPDDPQGKLRLGERFVRLCRNLTSRVRGVLNGWRRPQLRNLPTNVELMDPARLRSAPTPGKTAAVVSNDAEPSQIAS